MKDKHIVSRRIVLWAYACLPNNFEECASDPMEVQTFSGSQCKAATPH